MLNGFALEWLLRFNVIYIYLSKNKKKKKNVEMLTNSEKSKNFILFFCGFNLGFFVYLFVAVIYIYIKLNQKNE